MDPQQDLFTAIKAGDAQKVAELLLEAGAQVNPRKADGRTPLGLALEYGHEPMADLLRMQGGEG